MILYTKVLSQAFYDEFGETPQEWAKRFREHGVPLERICTWIGLAFNHRPYRSTVYRWFATEEEYQKRLRYNAEWLRNKNAK